ncbi:LysM peptidoglycan-binding domain-containing protein [Globicatella sulfidifaciens]|uniref:LysM peptidoglycan-binding domain-containing protein n=1 Tax=Globicatella sulfidifaciens TaxID=136093 RepID=UPI00288F004C|nr:LysM peptidoglycan-binding domain-containing protein [Globicatella sulfidifaciens]MDT2768477.1 LysM peptidoglycan-binding domain-containing protein [Globicatella sulfidifaciens]
MKKSLRIAAATMLASTLAFNLNTVGAQTWTHRSVNQVKETLANNEDGLYVIQWGDTLSTIAEATGHSVDQLANFNAIADADFIAAGSVLYFDDANQTVTYVDNATDQAYTYDLVEETQVVAEVTEAPVVEETVATEPTYYVDETPEWVETPAVETTEAFVEETTAAPVVEETEALVEETTAAPVVEETEVLVEETTAAPVVEETEALVEETTAAPVVEETEAVVEETTAAPVVEETEAIVEETTAAPVVEETEAVVEETTTAPSTSGGQYNEYGGIISDAKEWIAMRESGGQYEIWNPTQTYYGRYQLTKEYLKGDYSRENQERVADEYVLNRYGSWEAALVFWQANGWY